MYTKHDKVRYSGFIDPIDMALSVMAVIWFFVGFFGQEKVNWSPIALGLGTLILATILERKHT